MVAYRPHRGALVDSLKEMKIFNTSEEMMEYIEKNNSQLLDYLSGFKNKLIPLHENKRLSIDDKVRFDERCGWNTRYVLSYGNCIGMCDLDYKEK